MSLQRTNKRIVQRLLCEVLEEGRLAVLDEIVWPDHVEHYPFPGELQGGEGLKQRASIVRAAFDPTYTIEHLIAEGDKVAVMWSARCEHVGEWFDFPPSGKSVTFRGVDFLLLRDGPWPSTGMLSTAPSSWLRWARCPLQPGRLERSDDLSVATWAMVRSPSGLPGCLWTLAFEAEDASACHQVALRRPGPARAADVPAPGAACPPLRPGERGEPRVVPLA